MAVAACPEWQRQVGNAVKCSCFVNICQPFHLPLPLGASLLDALAIKTRRLKPTKQHARGIAAASESTLVVDHALYTGRSLVGCDCDGLPWLHAFGHAVGGQQGGPRLLYLEKPTKTKSLRLLRDLPTCHAAGSLLSTCTGRPGASRTMWRRTPVLPPRSALRL